MSDLRLAILGGGNMGEAILRGILTEGLAEAHHITLGEPLAPRRDHLESSYGIRAAPSNTTAVDGARIVILAVKPQALRMVTDELRGTLGASQIVLSIVAGASISQLASALGHQAIVRAMPNAPAQIGEGVSVWTSSAAVSKGDRSTIRSLLRGLGMEIEVDDERYLDMATALSASGPAYVFLFLEALIDAGVSLGFDRQMASTLAIEMIRGSILFAKRSGAHPAELRAMITSPGGTTAAALREMESGRIRAVIIDAVWAAYERTRSLGGATET